MKNRAPYVLAGVPVLGCESCEFLCSDERYLTAHITVEHEKDIDRSNDESSASHDNYVKAVKNALQNGSRKKREIEAAIASTSKTLGYLYAALLSDATGGSIEDATKIMERVMPSSTGTVETNGSSPIRPASPEQTESGQNRISNLISPPETSRKRKISIGTSSEETTSLNLNDVGTGQAETGQTGATFNTGINRIGPSTLTGLTDMERAHAIIETIKRARLAQQEKNGPDDEEDEPVIVQPTGPPGEATSLPGIGNCDEFNDGSKQLDSDDEIIEIPIDEPDHQNGFITSHSAFKSTQNPALHQLLNHTSQNQQHRNINQR